MWLGKDKECSHWGRVEDMGCSHWDRGEDKWSSHWGRGDGKESCHMCKLSSGLCFRQLLISLASLVVII